MNDAKQQICALYNRVFSDVGRGTLEDEYEFMKITYEILENDEFRDMSHVSHHIYTSRLMHSLRVAYACYLTCKKRGWDYRSVARGALLHDWFRVDRGYVKRRVKMLLGFYHPRMAMNKALTVFDLNPIEQDCILRHMFPLTIVPAKYKEAWTVIYWDKVWGTKETLNLIPKPVLVYS